MENIYIMSSRQQRKLKTRVFKLLILLVLVVGIFGIFKVAKYVPALYQLFFQKEIQLKETKEKRVNLLILGVGGGTHEGPDLTDTMIFASIDPATKKVTMVSIPRDLWIPELHAKINTAYTYGEEKQKGGGLVLTKAIVAKLLGQQIDYAVKIDFDGFTKAIDLVGGLDIEVEHTFDDYQYPITGSETDSCGNTEEKIASLSAEIATGSASELDAFPCRYEHLHFDKGLTRMAGERALKYVRSRHGTNGEGSDFARSKRQEKVITAFKEKFFSVDTFLNPVKIVSVIDTFRANIDMDIKDNELDDFVKLAQKIKGAKIASSVLDTGDEGNDREGLLIHPTTLTDTGGQWVLIPREGNGDYSEINRFVSCQISYGNCIVGTSGILTPTPVATASAEKNESR